MTIGIVFVARCAARGLLARDHDDFDSFATSSAEPAVQTIHVAIGVDESILDVLALQPAEIMHPLLGRRVADARPWLLTRTLSHPTRRIVCGRLSASESVRDEQADAATRNAGA